MCAHGELYGPAWCRVASVRLRLYRTRRRQQRLLSWYQALRWVRYSAPRRTSRCRRDRAESRSVRAMGPRRRGTTSPPSHRACTAGTCWPTPRRRRLGDMGWRSTLCSATRRHHSEPTAYEAAVRAVVWFDLNIDISKTQLVLSLCSSLLWELRLSQTYDFLKISRKWRFSTKPSFCDKRVTICNKSRVVCAPCGRGDAHSITGSGE